MRTTETEKTYNKIAEGYTENYRIMNVTAPFRKKFSKLIRSRNVKVLDIGCGPGFDTSYFSERFDATGFDFSTGMLKIARAKFPGCKFVKVDMRRINFHGKVDGVWISQSLPHITKIDAKKLLKKLRLRLRKGGIVFISVVEGSSEGLTDKSKNKIISGKKRYLAMYTASELEDMLKRLGYQILSMPKIRRKQSGEVYINAFARNT